MHIVNYNFYSFGQAYLFLKCHRLKKNPPSLKLYDFHGIYVVNLILKVNAEKSITFHCSLVNPIITGYTIKTLPTILYSAEQN